MDCVFGKFVVADGSKSSMDLVEAQGIELKIGEVSAAEVADFGEETLLISIG